MKPYVPPPPGPSLERWERMGIGVTFGGIAFTVGAIGWLVHDRMAWRTAVLVMPPFALLAAAFGWIFHTKKSRAPVLIGTIWGVVVLTVALVESCSGK
ncbi:hypothetical protein [Xanthobacter sp. KR7-225]|uniref:hypothetical protein n=1 Tax=Xanthobacter sp. KR7-225 TaxID=3156613 RepID=UPI0032B4966B